MTSTWVARRSGESIRCGRQVAGRYACQGVLATGSSLDPDGTALLLIPDLLVEDPPGSLHFRPSARALRKLADGRDPLYDRGGRMIMEPRWTRLCPHCGCIALIDSAQLGRAGTVQSHGVG